MFLPNCYGQSLFWWHRCRHHSISVGNFGSNHGWKLVETAESHSKISKEFFWDGYAFLHTICGTALSVVFDLQVDVPRTSFFSLSWFLAEDRTQQPIRQNPHRTHWQIVRKMWELGVSFTVREHSQEILGRYSCFTAVAKSLSCALGLMRLWQRSWAVERIRTFPATL